MTFCGLLYGLMAYQPVGFLGYIFSATIVTFAYNYFTPIELSVLHNSLLAHLVGLTTFVLASLIRTTLQLSYVGNLLMSMERAKKEQIEKNFKKMKSREDVIKRYIRPSVLAEIALGEDPLSYTPCKTISSIMFIDMRSYTTHTENLELFESYKLLNDYFERVNSSVFKFQGEVDKIMGDAVMATFDSPIQCINACKEMRENLVKINQLRNKKGEAVIRFGSGISYGEVLSANFGSRQKIDRTIVGDPVNIGARLEQLTKEYRVDVLAMDEFVKQVDKGSSFRVLDHVMVKGRYRPVKIYEFYGHACDEVIAYKNSTKRDLEEIVQLKIERNYIVALNILDYLINNCPPHRIWKNTIMDPALLVVKNKIEILLMESQRSGDITEINSEVA
jgi:class 3 adenylate cyclase